ARSKRGSHNTRGDAARKMAIEYGRWHIRKIPVPTVAKMNQQAVNTSWERPPTGGADGAILPSNLSGTTDRVEEAALKLGHARVRRQRGRPRSEEHTSELQSRFDLVCRLLLEKKKKNKNK